MKPRIIKKWECRFESGRPVLEDPEGFKRNCEKLEGKKGFVSLIPYRKMKTNEQNRYYRGVIVAIFADYWGSTNEEAHQALSNEHLKYQKTPEMPALTKSTALSEWSTGEWEDYMIHLRNWGASTFGLYIPEPNEVDLSALQDIWH